MVDAVLTHQNIPTGYRLLPTICRYAIFSSGSLSLSLSLSSRCNGLDLISRTASIDYHSLASSSPSISLRIPPFVCSIRVIPGSNSSQSHAVISKASRPIRKSNEHARRVGRRNGYIAIKSWRLQVLFCNFLREN